MAITKTPQRTLYDTNNPVNKMVNVGNADSVILMLTVKTGGTGGFLSFKGSAQSSEPNMGSASSESNFHTPVAVNDLDTGKTYEGSVGISVASVRQVMLEVNTRFLQWLGVDDQFDGGAIVKIDYVCIHQN